MKYRMYIDEVGNSDLGASGNPNHRYLSLTGIIISLDHVRDYLHPTLEDLKRRYFGAHPDEPIVLHRKDMLRRRQPFEALRDASTRKAFDAEVLELLQRTEYSTLTVVIDKLEHKERYARWRFDPYHYCLTVVVERYARWLQRIGYVGDVLAESRGGKSDMRLKKSFEKLYREGTQYEDPALLGNTITSRELKVKPKANNIAGLQLADLIAHPSFRSMKLERENSPIPNDFGTQVAQILIDSKYQRSNSGKIEGWGRKWLP